MLLNSRCYQKEFLGMICTFINDSDYCNSNAVVYKDVNKYKVSFDKNLKQTRYEDFYKEKLEQGEILKYKSFYIIKSNTKVEKSILNSIEENNNKMSDDDKILFDSLKNQRDFGMCKAFINEIKKGNKMSNFFKRKLEEKVNDIKIVSLILETA
ncbi:hypothetical protein BFS06_12150 [Clostridium perfringens]|uniref:Uncharacterized protein n=1 Tax=Clostridium perfringens TaxID=1502 RepID=A0A140GQZ8_CLOPF|nr:hypothetical protein [Clostridium perfringens]AMN30957.1 hypothetical protein JFP838_pA0041 [Clostridium perfringens]TBX14953.1 hypothetical protein BFS06_12150 [Clostridium perfringens]